MFSLSKLISASGTPQLCVDTRRPSGSASLNVRSIRSGCQEPHSRNAGPSTSTSAQSCLESARPSAR